MFSDLTKLLSKEFVTAFGLPAAYFLLVTMGYLSVFGFDSTVQTLSNENPIVDTAILTFLSWAFGMVLQVMNRPIIRYLEGYGNWLNIAHYSGFIEKRRFRRLRQKVNFARTEALAGRSRGEFTRLWYKLASEFPYDIKTGDQKIDERYILPTSFGNIIRSAEIYALTMYGFDIIDGWGRLLTVIPKDFQDIISSTKAQVDLWVNIRVLSLFLVLEYLAFAVITKKNPALWSVPILILIAFFALTRARSAAKIWGIMLKSAVDVYLIDLAKRLPYQTPRTHEETQEFWTKFRTATTFKHRAKLLEIPYQSEEASEHENLTRD